MLELIVLGQIPGTTIQITFEQILLTSLLLCVFVELFLLHKRRNVTQFMRHYIERVSL